MGCYSPGGYSLGQPMLDLLTQTLVFCFNGGYSLLGFSLGHSISDLFTQEPVLLPRGDAVWGATVWVATVSGYRFGICSRTHLFFQAGLHSWDLQSRATDFRSVDLSPCSCKKIYRSLHRTRCLGWAVVGQPPPSALPPPPKKKIIIKNKKQTKCDELA